MHFHHSKRAVGGSVYHYVSNKDRTRALCGYTPAKGWAKHEGGSGMRCHKCHEKHPKCPWCGQITCAAPEQCNRAEGQWWSYR